MPSIADPHSSSRNSLKPWILSVPHSLLAEIDMKMPFMDRDNNLIVYFSASHLIYGHGRSEVELAEFETNCTVIAF
jgi:hypothetical protein